MNTRQFIALITAFLSSLLFWRRSAKASPAKAAKAKHRNEELIRFFDAESGRVALDISRQIRDSSPWFRIIRQFSWPIYEGVALPHVSGSKDNLPWNYTLNEYGLHFLSLTSRLLCLDDLRCKPWPATQIDSTIEAFGETVKLFWIERKRTEFHRLCGVREGTPDNPVSIRRIGPMLEEIERNGAGLDCISIIGGFEALERIKNPGCEVDDFPVHYRNGVRLLPFLDVVADKNEINPAYEEDYDAEAIYLVHPEVYHQLSNFEEEKFGKKTYGIKDYIGTSSWKMIPGTDGNGNVVLDSNGNPYLDVGRWMMTINSTSKPMQTNFGGVIIVRRQS